MRSLRDMGNPYPHAPEVSIVTLALVLPARTRSGRLGTTQKMESPHGLKYIMDGKIETPSGKSPRVRTIWIVDQGLQAPRLVTAYPFKD